MTKVLLAGDWHGNYQWAHSMIKRAHQTHPDIDTILHLGDFGIWPGHGGVSYLNQLNWLLDRYGMDIWVTPGNHEDYDQIEQGQAQSPDFVWTPRNHIHVMPRGYRFEYGDRTFVSLGGAPSIDKKYRTVGQSWWPQEAITEADVEKTVSGGYADVMLTHDSPGAPYWAPAVEDICSNDHRMDPDLRNYLNEGRQHITNAVEGVQPKLLVHGHYHALSWRKTRAKTFSVQTIGLNCDGEDGNCMVLETETLRLSLL